MEEFTYDELEKKFFGAATVFLHLVTEYEQKHGLKAFEEFIEPKKFKIELKINGVEFPFTSVLEKLWKRSQEDLEREAAILVAEKAENQFTEIENLLSEFKSELETKIRKVFPNALPNKY